MDSNCSERISKISIERKIPCFKTNFEEDINNNGKKRILIMIIMFKVK